MNIHVVAVDMKDDGISVQGPEYLLLCIKPGKQSFPVFVVDAVYKEVRKTYLEIPDR